MELVSENIKYSFCTTVYNSVETIQRFYDSISKSMTENSELVIVDSFSKDGTYEKLLEISEKDPRVKVIRKKCWRGKGRQIAIENSNGEIIIMVDADVKYVNINKYIEEFEKNYVNKILNCVILFNGNNLGFVIGKKSTFNLLGGYPNLNNAEDVYLYKVAKCLDLFVQIRASENDLKPIPVKNLSSGSERRYATNVLEAIKRRLIATRDTLFVNKYKPKDLFKKYNLTGGKKLFIGYPLFIIGKFLSITIKDETIESRCNRINSLRKK